MWDWGKCNLFACIDVLLIGQWGSFLEPILKDFVQNYKEFNF